MLPLTVGMVVRFEAVSPTTGAPVAGVTVANATLYATDAGLPTDDKFESLPPLLTYGPGTGAA